jgi:UDP-2,4-diacetamido-2,4,6-trideoxy-beta-L-altropyranose hydrolase
VSAHAQRRVLIRADASASIGVGHVMRCLALAGALAELGIVVAFAASGMPDTVARRIASGGHALHALDGAPGSDADVASTQALAMGFDGLVIDSYAFGQGAVAYLGQGSRVTVIDDYAEGPVVGAGIVVNQNIYAPRAAPEHGLLFGLDYALLRKDVLVPSERRQPRKGRVLVTLGGGDPDGLTAFLADALLAVEGVSGIDLVIGSTNPRFETLSAFARNAPLITLHHDIPHLAPLLAAADLAIVAAGGTMWECLAAGVAMIVVDRDAVQAKSVEALLSRDLIVGRIKAADMPKADVAAIVSAALINDAQRARLSLDGRAYVDGLGAGRVARSMARGMGVA